MVALVMENMMKPSSEAAQTTVNFYILNRQLHSSVYYVLYY